jgi:hypothetical protein
MEPEELNTTGTWGFAIHLMTNTAITGVTYDIDGAQQLLEQ